MQLHLHEKQIVARHGFFTLIRNYLKILHNPNNSTNIVNMIFRFISFMLVYCLASVSSSAANIPYPAIFSKPPIERYEPEKYPQFEMIDRELHNLITAFGDPNIDNKFCISGFKFSDNDNRLAVLWDNEGLYYFWHGALEESKEESKTLLTSKYLDIKNPVDDSVLFPGTAGVFRSEAESIVDDCKKYGKEYLINPFTPTPQKSDDDNE